MLLTKVCSNKMSQLGFSWLFTWTQLGATQVSSAQVKKIYIGWSHFLSALLRIYRPDGLDLQALVKGKGATAFFGNVGRE